MKSTYPAGVCAAVVIAFSAAAFAQATPSNQTPSTTPVPLSNAPPPIRP